MDSSMLLAQAVGMVATIISILSFQCKDNRKLFLIQIASSSIFAVHYLLLGAYTGLLLNLAGVVRLIFLYNGQKKWARHTASMVGVTLLMALCGVVTWNGWLSLLPTAATALGTPFYWSQNGKTLRWAQLCFISPCWLIYNIAQFSIPGVITEVLAILSVVISLIRFRGIEQITPNT